MFFFSELEENNRALQYKLRSCEGKKCAEQERNQTLKKVKQCRVHVDSFGIIIFSCISMTLTFYTSFSDSSP